MEKGGRHPYSPSPSPSSPPRPPPLGLYAESHPAPSSTPLPAPPPHRTPIPRSYRARRGFRSRSGAVCASSLQVVLVGQEMRKGLRCRHRRDRENSSARWDCACAPWFLGDLGMLVFGGFVFWGSRMGISGCSPAFVGMHWGFA